MNTAILTHRLPRLAAGCALALAGMAIGSATDAAQAADHGAATHTIVVQYRDLDLATDQGNLKLYQRIVAAAKQVCPLEITPDLDAYDRRAACRARAIADAVSQVGSPLLAAVYADEAKHG